MNDLCGGIVMPLLILERQMKGRNKYIQFKEFSRFVTYKSCLLSCIDLRLVILCICKLVFSLQYYYVLDAYRKKVVHCSFQTLLLSIPAAQQIHFLEFVIGISFLKQFSQAQLPNLRCRESNVLQIRQRYRVPILWLCTNFDTR